LIEALARASRATCMILLIVVGAKIFGVVLTLTQVTQSFVSFATSLDTSPYVVLTLIIAVYIVLGCFLDQVATMILSVPITAPVVVALGFDPIWFGVIVVVTAEIGMITPPLGLNAFIVSRYAHRPLSEVFGGLWPHILAQFIVLAILCAFPQIALWLPSTAAAP
jgi:C4-dicarboxylate transporter DctM subunit